MKAVSIGTFDGVHRGHRSVLKTLSDYARTKGLHPLAITFKSHPLAVISPEREPRLLTSVLEKKKLLHDAGVEVLVLDFDEKMRSTTAEEWLRILKDKYEVKALILGYDSTFGCDGLKMSIEDYKRIGVKIGVDVIMADEVKGVSSSVIRKAVTAGDMKTAMELLGRPYSITGNVETGNSIGHIIGFPTANISLPKGMIIPKSGVYAAVAKIPGHEYELPAMVNIGTHPTVKREDKPVIEAHIINWTGNLYNMEITVRFIKRLRDEKKFNSVDELKTQLVKDKKTVLSIIS